MKKRIAASILLLGALLSGCSDTRLPDSLTKPETAKANEAGTPDMEQTASKENDVDAQGGEEPAVGIDPDSRDAVIRSLGYDRQKNETSKVFIIHISDELENKDEIVEEITSSQFCREWHQVYSLQAEIQMQKEQLNPEWIAWNDSQDGAMKVNDSINAWGYVDPFDSIYSAPEQEETLITASQLAEGYSGYAGALAVNCEAGDELKILYIPKDLEMDKWDTVQPQPVAVDRVTMDTPWWINTASSSSEPQLVLSWEDYKEIVGDDLDTKEPFYVVWDQGDNQELRKLVEELCAEYGADNKMILFAESYFNPM